MTPRILVLAAALGLALGCSSETEPATVEPPATSSTAAASGAEGEAVKPDPNASWRETKSLVLGDGDASIVRCKHAGREQFMRRNDCISRGGRILR